MDALNLITLVLGVLFCVGGGGVVALGAGGGVVALGAGGGVVALGAGGGVDGFSGKILKIVDFTVVVGWTKYNECKIIPLDRIIIVFCVLFGKCIGLHPRRIAPM